MTGLVERAAAFAKERHTGHLRKYTGADYYMDHLVAVAHRVALMPEADEIMVAAAYLHDVIEDTPTTYEEVAAEFGTEVAGLVRDLTHVFTSEAYPHLNRAARKKLEAERLAKISPRAKLIKYADFAHNTVGITEHAPAKFAKMWCAERDAALAAMKAA